MPRQARAAYLAGARDLEALATLASGENPDGTAFTLPTDATATSADTTMQSAATGIGNGTAVATSGMAVLGIQVTGTFVGTLTWEATIDGTNWVAVPFTDAATGLQSTTATAPGIYNRRVGAFKQVRARISAYTSGSITATGHAMAEGDVGMVPAAMYGKSSVAGDVAALLSPAGRQQVSILSSSTFNGGGITATLLSRSDDATVLGAVAAASFNGTNWDPQCNNQAVTVLASAARTIATNSSDITNHNGRYLRIDIDITAVAGSPSLVFTVKAKDALSGVYSTILASAALTGTGHTVLLIGPGLLAAANAVANAPLPRVFRVEVTVGSADSVMYSIGAVISV